MEAIVALLKALATFEAAISVALVVTIFWWMERTERQKILKELTSKIERLTLVLESNRDLLRLALTTKNRE